MRCCMTWEKGVLSASTRAVEAFSPHRVLAGMEDMPTGTELAPQNDAAAVVYRGPRSAASPAARRRGQTSPPRRPLALSLALALSPSASPSPAGASHGEVHTADTLCALRLQPPRRPRRSVRSVRLQREGRGVRSKAGNHWVRTSVGHPTAGCAWERPVLSARWFKRVGRRSKYAM